MITLHDAVSQKLYYALLCFSPTDINVSIPQVFLGTKGVSLPIFQWTAASSS